ncbi:hypothetical protein E2320_010010 [Naja naja]|nr:hypothetical protein E2320_010010 [Naja naja]
MKLFLTLPSPLSAQVSPVAGAALFQLHLVHQLCLFMGFMIHILVSFEIGYYNVLDMKMPLKEIYKLLWLQNGTAELLCRIFFLIVLSRLHWLPVVFQDRFKWLVLTHGSLYGLDSAHLIQRLSHHVMNWEFYSSFKDLLQVLYRKDGCLEASRISACSVVAPTL